MSVYGFRQWTVTPDGELGPGFIWHLPPWPVTSPAVAKCYYSRRGLYDAEHTEVEPPEPGHHCGLWIHQNPIPPCECEDPADPIHGVVGVARCWGRYRKHETGWRFQYAIPVAFVDYTGRVDPRYTARRYPDLRTLNSEWAPDSTRWADLGTQPQWCEHTRTMAALRASYLTLQIAVRDLASQARAAAGTLGRIDWSGDDRDDTPGGVTPV